jgi:uncharacterized protein YbjT (DUF2867 family)
MDRVAPLTSALVVGATGLVGRECVRQLLAADDVERVVTLARRELPAEVRALPGASRLEAHVVDFDTLEASAPAFTVSTIFCALGTTIRQAGSQERFRQVDFDYPLAVARLGLARGARHFLLVSALGADASSRVFYSRVKGELESAVIALRYPSTTIVRPSLLVGERAEPRRGEEIGKRLAFLVPRRYKPVSGGAVAATLVRAAREARPGVTIIESRDIR